MHFKLPRRLVDDMITFVTTAANEHHSHITDTYGAITALAFDHIIDGDFILLPVKSVKKILEVPESGSTKGLIGLRQNIIHRVWGCELVDYKPLRGYWKIRIPKRNPEEYVYMDSNKYYEIKDFYDSGKKIMAIKLIREETGLGLKDAMAVYEDTFIMAVKVDKKPE